MSSESLPISNPRFAAALKDLSLASLHLKTLEIRNSLAHLAYSNAQLRPFADGTQATLDTAAAAAASTDGTNNPTPTVGLPDPDCVEAIRENEAVMRRMRERIELVRAEVEGRGLSWREFEGEDEVEDTEPGVLVPAASGLGENIHDAGDDAGQHIVGASLPPPLTNGVNGHVVDNNNDTNSTRRGNPWTDGTFQTGVIRNGEVHMDAVPGSGSSGGDGGSGSGNGNDGRAAGGDGAPTTTAAASTTGGRLTDEDLRRLLEQRLAEDDDADEDGGLHL